MADYEFSKGFHTLKVNGQFGDFYSIAIKLGDFVDWARQYRDNKGYIHLIMAEKKDKTGWYCRLDGWDSEKKQYATKELKWKKEEKPTPTDNEGEDKIPF